MEEAQNKIFKEYPFDLGKPLLQITTKSDEAQVWFNYALLQTYGFNHEETISCCDKAVKFDEQCAMAYLLSALAEGVNYNNCPELLEVDQAKNQFERWQKADKYKSTQSEFEKDIIEAVKYRVGDGKTLEHAEFNKQYAKHIGQVYDKYCKNPEKNISDDAFCFLAGLYAEAMMNLRPWNLWVQIPKDDTEKSGDPYENTNEIHEVLENALKRNEHHVGIRHLWIHLHELSKHPEKGLCGNYEKYLRDLAVELGHLNHMPSHIEILCGKYQDAIISNQIGVASDDRYFEWRKSQGMSMNCFFLLYRSHNIHFLVYAALFQGNFKIAHEAALKLLTLYDLEFLEDTSYFKPNGAVWLESFMATIIHVLIRFGKWEQLIEDPFEGKVSLEFLIQHNEVYQSTIATFFYGQAIAYAVLAGKQKGKYEEYLKKALQCQELFLEQYNSISDERTLFNNTVKDILAVGVEMAEGEILYRQEKYEEAFEHLRKAVYKYDNLPYDEPWGWMVPARHALAALMLEQGVQTNNKELVEASEKEYRIDLGEGGLRSVAHPDNIWSLIGLKQCNKFLKKEDAELEKRIQEQLQYSDIEIKASCLCSIKQMSF